MTVGGDSEGGGTGGPVSIESAGLVTTYGDHAVGLQAQSVGGGGGNGGVAISTIGGIVPTAAVAVGGRGGGGGPADKVTITNSGQVTTYGPDAYGLQAQSVGGGNGGTAAATAVDVSVNEDVPAISVAYSAGGSGGSGNTPGKASAMSSGIITTAGHGAIGIIAQSVGGGGGTAGDSSASSYSAGKEELNVGINVAVSLGGSGGSGATGGESDAGNSGLVYTTGQDAYGLFAQSVGGGGGAGGAGDNSATSVLAANSVGVSIGVGGSGGTGGTGGAVNASNTGSIGTRGDSSDGVFAQSVGGGGGAAGGGSGANSGGKLGVDVTVGGSGGAGGDGGAVTATNGGVIATIGTDSIGLAAQSVGGGGGRGGKAGASSGGAEDDLPLFVFDQIEDGFGDNTETQEVVDKIFLLKDRIKGDTSTLSKLVARITGNAEEGKEPESFSPEIDVSVGIGGSGGAAGVGGGVSLTNTGQIGTQGAHADGIVGQSVGGGGGIGGGSSASGAATDDTRFEVSVAAGGSGGAAGNGGEVDIGNQGLVQTEGVGAYGIVAQSAGGGGGRGAASADDNSSALSIGVSLGGAGGATGNGGLVDIGGLPGSSVATSGKHAVGILAQSVGGGGMIRTLSLDQQGDQSSNSDNDDPDTHDLFLDFGKAGAGGASGSGGPAVVDLKGSSVTTTGRMAHGVVVSSIGGGGGAVGGGVVTRVDLPNQADASNGSGGLANVNIQDSTIQVTGTGANGIWASSIGGGGAVLLGDITAEDFSNQEGNARAASGNGGNVSVGLANTQVSSSGHGIIAHSIAGGGVSPSDGGGEGLGFTSSFANLSAFGNGVAGKVFVNIAQNSTVTATGPDSSAIIAGARQDEDKNPVDPTRTSVTVENNSSTITNQSLLHPTIWLPVSDVVTSVTNNGGVITNKIVNGYALASDGLHVTLTNTGTITGNIEAGITTSSSARAAPLSAAAGAAPLILNRPGGTLAPYSAIDLAPGGRVENGGRIEVGGVGRIARTRLTGDLLQSATGRLRFDLDFGSGESRPSGGLRECGARRHHRGQSADPRAATGAAADHRGRARGRSGAGGSGYPRVQLPDDRRRTAPRPEAGGGFHGRRRPEPHRDRGGTASAGDLGPECAGIWRGVRGGGRD